MTTPYLGKGELGAVVEILTAQLLSCDQETIADITGKIGFLLNGCIVGLLKGKRKGVCVIHAFSKSNLHFWKRNFF